MMSGTNEETMEEGRRNLETTPSKLPSLMSLMFPKRGASELSSTSLTSPAALGGHHARRDGSKAFLQRSHSSRGFSPRSPGRPKLTTRESSKFDMADVYKTLREHGGQVDIERELEIERPSCCKPGTHDVDVQTHFPTGSTRSIEEVPLGAIYATLIIAYNAVIMLAAEVAIEILVLVEVYPKIPFRLVFLFLTVISGLLGAQTLIAVNRKEFDTSQNALQVAFLVELALVSGDVEFMLEEGPKYPAAIPTRLPFVILTTVNLVLVIYLYYRLRLYESRRAVHLPELVRPVDMGLGTFREVHRTLQLPRGRASRTWTLDDLGQVLVRHIETQEVKDMYNLPDGVPIAPSGPQPPERLSVSAAGNTIINMTIAEEDASDLDDTTALRGT